MDKGLKKLEKEIGNPTEYEFDEKWEYEVLKEVNGSDKFLEYLKNTMGLDVLRYFNASTDIERAQIKGAYSRTKYMHAKILRSRKAEEYIKKK